MTPQEIIDKCRADLLESTGTPWNVNASPIVLLPGMGGYTVDSTSQAEQTQKDYIVSVVCKENGMTPKELYTKHLSRITKYNDTRFMIWYLLRERRWAFKAIAQEFMRDHSSVKKSLPKHHVYLECDPVYRDTFERILIKLQDNNL